MVVKCIFDADLGKLSALVIKPSNILAPTKYVAAIDVFSYEQFAILCSETSLSALDDLVNVKKNIKSRRPILGQHAKTESGKSLGRVTEVMFDDQTDRIVQIHTQLMLRRRVLKYEDVIEITRKAVVFRTDLAKQDAIETEAIPAEAEPA